jgi:hypothetical protein
LIHQRLRCSIGMFRALTFHLHSERAELLAADVLESVRREGHAPDRCSRYRPRFRRPGVGKHIPVGIASDEIAGPEDIKHSSPAVGVHRYRRTRWNPSVENSDSIVFEQDRVEPWCSDHGVEVVGPGPRGGRNATSQRNDSLRTDIDVRRYSDLHRPSLPRSPTPEGRSLGPRGHEPVRSTRMAELMGLRRPRSSTRSPSPVATTESLSFRVCGHVTMR